MTGPSYLSDGTAYRVHGDPAAPPVIFIHGLGLNSEIWQPFITGLEGRNRLVCYDLYGHGKSRSLPVQPTLSGYAEQLRSLMDHLHMEKAFLVGFSLGGMINRRFALDHPERVSGLAIFNSPHERDPTLQEKVERQAGEAGTGGPSATLEAALDRWLTNEFRQEHPQAEQRIRTWVLSCVPSGYAAARRILAFGVRELVRPEPPLACLALVMTCENDVGSTPDMSRAIAAEIPGARLRIVPQLKHLGILEEPDSFLEPMQEVLKTIR